MSTEYHKCTFGSNFDLMNSIRRNVSISPFEKLFINSAPGISAWISCNIQRAATSVSTDSSEIVIEIMRY